MAVQFVAPIDMNGNTIINAAEGTNPTDVVTVSQLATASWQGFAQDVGDGTATSFTLAHNFGLSDENDVIVQVARVVDGQRVNAEIAAIDGNNIEVTFPTAPAASQYRVVMIPVPTTTPAP